MIGRLIEAWRYLRALVRRDEVESGLDEEIRFHIEQQTAKNERAGMTPAEARRQAHLRFGGVERFKEGARDEFRMTVVEDFLRDLRYGIRALRRAPGFAAVGIATLGLGIGATTAMFSVVNGVLLRPLPYPNQERVVELVHDAPGVGLSNLMASPAIYFAYRDHSRVFESVGLWDWDRSPVTVTGAGDPQAVLSAQVTHEVLGLLGADPILGRPFTAEDDQPAGSPVAIITHQYWQRRFGGADPLGETLVVDGIARQVIGVLPPWFRFFDYPADIFYPLQPVRSAAGFPSFDGRGLARMKPGVTVPAANDDVARVIPMLMDEFGAWPRGQFTPRLRLLRDTVVGQRGDTLWMLMGTVGLLLLIACANVSNLVLVRTQARRQELAIRTALGAGWGAIARVVFAESAILGLAGGAAGVAVAYASLPLLLSLGASDLPQIMTVTIDPTVLLVALAISVLTTFVFALIPIRHLAPRLQVTDALHGGTRAVSEGRDGGRARQALVVAQVALALVLLIGSGLMIRTFVTLRQVDPGFRDPGGALTFQLTIPAVDRSGAASVATLEQAVRLQQAIVDQLESVRGVQAAAFSAYNDGLPLDGDGRQNLMHVEGRTPPEGAAALKEYQFVSPRFFEAMQTPLVAGRTFDWNDIYDRRLVALVSENVARSQWGSAPAAVGQRISTNPRGPWREIVGVVKDVHHNGLNLPAPETVMLPVVATGPAPTDSASWRTAIFVVRSDRVGTAGFLDEVRRAVWSANPSMSLANVRTLGDLYRGSMARTTLALQLLAITGAVALVLGLIGVYGIVSYAIGRRRREIGIRLALGARTAEVRRMFVQRALVLVAVGATLGLGAAAVLTRLMASQLFGVSPLDPLTHVGVTVLLLAAAATASYLSARRASRLDPVEVLKGE